MKLTFYPSTKTGIYAITFMIMAVILMVLWRILDRTWRWNRREASLII